MAIKEYTTSYPTTQDPDPITTNQPDLDDGVDDHRSSQIEAIRDKVHAVAKKVGDDSDNPSGSILDIVNNNTVSGGEGLSGSSALVSNPVIDLDVNSLSEELSLDATADFMPFYDITAGSHKKIKPTNLPGGGGGGGPTQILTDGIPALFNVTSDPYAPTGLSLNFTSLDEIVYVHFQGRTTFLGFLGALYFRIMLDGGQIGPEAWVSEVWGDTIAITKFVQLAAGPHTFIIEAHKNSGQPAGILEADAELEIVRW